MPSHIVPLDRIKRSQAPEEFNIDYENLLDLKVTSKEDAAIVKFLSSVITPYSTFQSRSFVINTEVTDHRKIQQVGLEIKARVLGLADSTYKIKKAEIEVRKIQRALELEEDELEKELMELEIKKISFDVAQTKLLQEQSNYEINNFLEIAKEIAPENTLETIKNYKDNWEEKEEEYWIKRFGKQAMYDVMLSGKIQSGNLDSIIGMPLEAQQKVISYAMLQTQRMEHGISELGEAVRHVLTTTPENRQSYQLPDITGVVGTYGGKSTLSTQQLETNRTQINEKITYNSATARLHIR
jgi:hypothetical protein